MILSLYVDDLSITGINQAMITEFKKNMKKEFEMTDLGLMNFFLGLEVKQSEDGIFVSQNKYAKPILKRFKTEKCKTVSTPLVVNEKLSKDDGVETADPRIYRSLIGCLLYLIASWPDLMFSASLLSRFMQSSNLTPLCCWEESSKVYPWNHWIRRMVQTNSKFKAGQIYR